MFAEDISRKYLLLEDPQLFSESNQVGLVTMYVRNNNYIENETAIEKCFERKI